jgi:hypothetical protein
VPLAIVIAVAAGLTFGSPHALQGSSVRAVEKGVRPGVCEREALRLVARTPATIRDSVRAPKKRRDVRPNFPDLPPGTTGRGLWMGEALVDASGAVARVWPIREIAFTPPSPAFNAAIADAIRQWRYEPLRLEGRPAPFCLTMTLTIHWE